MKRFSGIIICIVIAAAAYAIAPFLPMDAVTIAIILGALTSNLITLPEYTQWGTVFGEKTILIWAIALLGFELDYTVLSSLGISALFMIFSGVVFTICMGIFWGRVFRLDKKLSLLLGIGNAVCGSSAIAASQGVIRASEEDVGLSIGAVNLLGTIGIIAIPSLAVSLGISGGKLIGNTLQAVGQVSAAGFSVSDTVGQTALLIKMGRILLLAPLVMLLSQRGKKRNIPSGMKKVPPVPLYILFFILFSVIGSLKILPQGTVSVTVKISKMLLVTAMAAIGMKIRFRELFKGASPALLAAVCIWFSQIGLTMLWLKI